jgi:hypothetical protein
MRQNNLGARIDRSCLDRMQRLRQSLTQNVRPRQRFLVFVQSLSRFVAEFKGCGFWAAVMEFCCWGGKALASHQANKMHHSGGKIALIVQVASLHMSNYCMQAERIVTLSSRLFCIAVR